MSNLMKMLTDLIDQNQRFANEIGSYSYDGCEPDLALIRKITEEYKILKEKYLLQDPHKVYPGEAIPGKPSCSRLSQLLSEVGISRSAEQVKDNAEAYGLEICAYVMADSVKHRRVVELFLTDRGVELNPDYSPGSRMMEIAITCPELIGTDD